MSSVASTFKPISVREFANALFSIWKPPIRTLREPSTKPETIKLALAVSGGVDSMALAYLMKQLSEDKGFQTRTGPTIVPFTFIVDHQIRAESSQEALKVSEWLSNKVGIKNQVLKIIIPQIQGLNDSDNANIERYGREARFKALGLACSSYKIKSLLLAHQEDDKAETSLMDLSYGRTHRQPIPAVAEIPECEGIHGVYQSGGQAFSERIAKDSNGIRWRAPTARVSETGGVKILRPLLSFPKGRLRATCEANGIPWVEDHTNSSVTYTIRNAARYLLNSGRLPRALQKESLLKHLDLISKRRQRATLAASAILARTVMQFEPRNGTLLIQFPDLGVPFQDHEYGIEDYELDFDTASTLVQRVLSIVTPDARISVHRVSSAVMRFFPWLVPTRVEGQSELASPAFMTGQVLVARVPSPLHWSQDRPVYLLCRARPYHKFDTLPIIPIPPKPSPFTSMSSEGEWTFFDGRYWIKVTNPWARPLVIRPLLQEDMAELLSTYRPSTRSRTRFEKYISEMTLKNGSRHVLPAIVEVARPEVFDKYHGALQQPLVDDFRDTQVKSTDSRAQARTAWFEVYGGRVVALPTLGWARAEDLEDGLRWDVRYKKLEPVLEQKRGRIPKAAKQENFNFCVRESMEKLEARRAISREKTRILHSDEPFA